MIRASEFKNIRLWPEIKNRKAFLIDKHPEFHPETQQYITYWREQKKRCIEGFWAEEVKGIWRYMSGNLYFYANMWTIKITDEANKTQYYSRPHLRDNEWIVFNAILAAQGFSGFEDDNIYTCHRLVKKHEDAEAGKKDKSGELIKLTKYEEKVLSNLEHVYNKTGLLKVYKEAYEFLKETHDTPLGRPVYENDVKNLLFLSCRGEGKSFQISSIGGHEFTFDGAKYYDNKIKLQSGVFVGAADGDKSTDLIIKIKDGIENLPGSYGEGEDFIPSPFFKQIKGTWAEGEYIEHSYKVQEGGQWKTKGSRSKIFHGNFGNDPHDSVGKRSSKIIVEEIGELQHVEKVHGANERVLKVGNNKFGMEIGIGTGGNVKYSQGLKKLFYNPSQYDYYEFTDYWENSGSTGLFIPATYAYGECKDENGNTNIEEALEICIDTRNKKSQADTSNPLDMEMMYSPLKPSEIFLNPNTNIFPVALCRGRQTELEIHGLFKAKAQFGTLEYNTSKDVSWIHDMSLKPITSYYIDERTDLQGCPIIYEHPGDLLKPKYDRSLIKITYDVVGDTKTGTSLASILVYKGLPDIIKDPSELRNSIIAEYIGRYNDPEKMHELCIKFCKYYNAKVLFETNVPGFKTYCRHTGNLEWLQPCPVFAMGEIYKGTFVKYDYGVRMTEQMRAYADLKIRSWLMTEAKKDDDGKNVKFNTDYLYSLRLLDEFVNYDGVSNFDHISSFRILMIWLANESLQPITATDDFKKENFFIDSVLKQRENNKKPAFLDY